MSEPAETTTTGLSLFCGRERSEYAVSTYGRQARLRTSAANCSQIGIIVRKVSGHYRCEVDDLVLLAGIELATY